MSIYSIARSNGSTTTHLTYAEAVLAARSEWSTAQIGHDGDLANGGERTLVWASEADSIDDDGARAVASIVASLAAGDRIESVEGTPAADHDRGRVVRHGDRGVYVAWDSGVSTWTPASVIRAEI